MRSWWNDLRACAKLLPFRRPARPARPRLDSLEDRVTPAALPAPPAAAAVTGSFGPLVRQSEAFANFPYRGEGYTVAVLDTGIDYRHPDLGGGFELAISYAGAIARTPGGKYEDFRCDMPP